MELPCLCLSFPSSSFVPSNVFLSGMRDQRPRPHCSWLYPLSPVSWYDHLHLPRDWHLAVHLDLCPTGEPWYHSDQGMMPWP